MRRIVGSAFLTLGLGFAGCADVTDALKDEAPDTESDARETDTDSDAHTDSDSDTETTDTGEPRSCPQWKAGPRSGPELTASPFRVEIVERKTADCLIVEDVDRDGHTDLVAVFGNDAGARVLFRFGTSAGEPVVSEANYSSDGRGAMLSCTLADADHDGDLDVLLGTSVGASALSLAGRTPTLVHDVLLWPEAVAEQQLKAGYLQPIDLDHTGAADLILALHGSINDECPDPTTLDTGDFTLPPNGDIVPGVVGCFVAVDEGGWVPAPVGRCPEPMIVDPTHAPYAALVADLNDDGHADLLLANDFAKNRLLYGSATGLTPTVGSGLEGYDHAMGVALLDLDRDGRRDVYITDLGPDSTFVSGTCSAWFEAGAQVGTWRSTRRTVSWGVQARDFDQDGAEDLLVGVGVEGDAESGTLSMCIDERFPFTVNHPPTLLLRADGAGGVVRIDVDDFPGVPGKATGYPVGVAAGDLDDDGDVDAVVSHGYGTVILWNDGPLAGPSFRVRVVGADGLPVLGARVIVKTTGGSHLRELWPSSAHQGWGEQVAHVGLGTQTGPVSVRVRWPDGTVTSHGPYEAGESPVTLTAP